MTVSGLSFTRNDPVTHYFIEDCMSALFCRVTEGAVQLCHKELVCAVCHFREVCDTNFWGKRTCTPIKLCYWFPE